MKTIERCFLMAAVVALSFSAGAAEPRGRQDSGVADQGSVTNPSTAITNEPSSGSRPDTPPPGQPPAETQAGTNAVEVSVAENGTTTNGGFEGLRLNFRGAPLNLVLDYLSDAAGFIINKQTEVRGTVEVWSKDPVTKEEAVELLNSVLKKNGYAVIRNGRILNIVALDTAKTADLEVVSGANPEEVERSDEIVTQIIPVRHASAAQLMNNLQVLLPTTATLTVNESANSLVLVATKTDIRRMLRIVSALDTSIASVSSIRVFPLRYADARQLSSVIQQLFAPQVSLPGMPGGRGQFFNMFGRGGFPGAPGGQGATSSGTSGNAAGSRVVASADEYSNSLIVSAAPDLMQTISDMVDQIDQPISDVTEIRVFPLKNADPAELADQFTQLFPDDSRTSNSSNQGGRFRFFGGGRFGMAGMMPEQTGSTERTRAKTRVVAVADPRTTSLIVTASSEMMPQIANMIEQLDSSPAHREKVAVYDLQNANPQDVYTVLQDLFNRNNTMRANNNNQNSMLGRNNPLTQRATQQQQYNSSTTSRFGNTGRGTTGGGF